MKDPTNPMPGDQQDYSPEYDEEKRRAEHMKLTPRPHDGHDEEADRIRRLRGGGGMGGEI
jgi:hypothetical protein